MATPSCGILLGEHQHTGKEQEGCIKLLGHAGPHEFVSVHGVAWHWETDDDCSCEYCMDPEEESCTVYWRKEDGNI